VSLGVALVYGRELVVAVGLMLCVLCLCGGDCPCCGVSECRCRALLRWWSALGRRCSVVWAGLPGNFGMGPPLVVVLTGGGLGRVRGLISLGRRLAVVRRSKSLN
jgi:hypothetical protein